MKRLMGFILLAAVLAYADRVDDAKASLSADIAAGKAAVVARQQEIARGRAALLARIDADAKAVAALEDRLATLRAETTVAGKEAAKAQQDAADAKRLHSFLVDGTIEFRRALDSRLGPAEAQEQAALLASLDAADSTPTDMVAAAATFGGASSGGAHRFAAQVVAPNGDVQAADVLRVGPVVCLRTATRVGLAVGREGTVYPVVFDRLPAAVIGDLRAVFANGVGRLPVDVTAGAATDLARSRQTWFEHLLQGGVTMVPMMALAIICLVLAVYKFLSLALTGAGGATERIADILAALRGGEVAAALDVANGLRRPLGPVIAEGIEHRDAPKEHIEEIMHERILAQLPGLERLLSPLAVCASVAPLLGLLGTVTGMIHTFRLITVFGTGNPKVLSAGISEALVTTEFGLMIAIPALLIHAYLSRRVRKTVAATEQSAIMFVNGLKLKREDGA